MLTRRAFMSRSKLVERPPEEGSRGWLIAELDRLRAALDKVTEEELRETFGRYRAMA